MTTTVPARMIAHSAIAAIAARTTLVNIAVRAIVFGTNPRRATNLASETIDRVAFDVAVHHGAAVVIGRRNGFNVPVDVFGAPACIASVVRPIVERVIADAAAEIARKASEPHDGPTFLEVLLGAD